MSNLFKALAAPCVSCPYRKDVPSGVWHPEEYDKLTLYDGETWEQHPGLFMCHQKDGNLCAGWLACHDPQELLAVRLHARELDPSVFTYSTKVPVFSSGVEAREHGLRDVEEPGEAALKIIERLGKR